MGGFLSQLGAVSLGGGAVVLLLLLAARLPRVRCAARWRCWAWLLLCLRLAVPIPLSAPDSGPSAAPIQLPAPRDTVVYTPPAPSASASSPARQPPAEHTPSAASSPSPGQTPQSAAPAVTLSQILFVLWLAGAAGVLLWNLGSHLRFLRYLRRWASPVEEAETLKLFWQLGEQLSLGRLPKLMRCSGLPVPMLAGVLRPVLLLPQEPLPPEQLRCSLLHELTHFRRRDIPFKVLVLWVTALHWFNPAVWLMSRAADRDTELACDDAVLSLLSPEEHAAYGRTILSAAERLKGAH